eukprot:TRINITY_DN9801_c0_g1_i1.p1 TRINITY_DN9801_c0_g1~~TRINITY_DN9801_c0_g1_i1.p1  ORF type:complete len:375 (+),score=34.15 TRINITY_DN9801_c0_g1_i1:129-1253(+)
MSLPSPASWMVISTFAASLLFAGRRLLAQAYDYDYEDYLYDYYKRVDDPTACSKFYVRTLDKGCLRSWVTDYDSARKPTSGIINLGHVDTAFVTRLRSLVETLPQDAWQDPPSKFGDQEPVRYDQAIFHFPVHTLRDRSSYHIYPMSDEVHPWIEPFLLNITRRYNYDVTSKPGKTFLHSNIPRLFLARLFPGQVQFRHVDAGASSEAPHKIHVPVSGEQDALLYVCPDECVGHKMDIGFAYEVNNRVPHWAENNGLAVRIHLVFEYMPTGLDSERFAGKRPVSLAEAEEYRFKHYVKARIEDFDNESQAFIREIDFPTSDETQQERYTKLTSLVDSLAWTYPFIPKVQDVREMLQASSSEGREGDAAHEKLEL